MLKFVARRLGVMVLTALALTFVVFYLTNLPPNLEKLARTEGSVRMTDQAVASWIENNGHGGSVFGRYAQWLGVAPGWVLTDDKGVTRGRCIHGDQRPRHRRHLLRRVAGRMGLFHRVQETGAGIGAAKAGLDRLADDVGDDRDGPRLADHGGAVGDARRLARSTAACRSSPSPPRPRRNMSRALSWWRSFASATAGDFTDPARIGAGSAARRCFWAPPPLRWTTSPSGTSPCRC